MKNITLLILLLFSCLLKLYSQDCFVYANKDKKLYFYENQKAMYIAFKRDVSNEKKQLLLDKLDTTIKITLCPSGFVLPKDRKQGFVIC